MAITYLLKSKYLLKTQRNAKIMNGPFHEMDLNKIIFFAHFMKWTACCPFHEMDQPMVHFMKWTISNLGCNIYIYIYIYIYTLFNAIMQSTKFKIYKNVLISQNFNTQSW